jgi:hypothetical protein
VVFFGMTLPVILAKDMAVRGPIKEVHEFMGNAVYFLVGLHVLGALWHQLFDRIPILQRMSLRSPLEIWRSAQRCAASMTTPSGCSDGVLLTGERFVKAIKNLTQAASMGFAEDQANPDEALEVAAEQGLNGGCFSLGITTRNHHDKSSPPPSSPSSLTVSLLSSLTLCAAFCSPLAAAAPPNTMPASVASLSDDLPSDFSDGLDATTREQVLRGATSRGWAIAWPVTHTTRASPWPVAWRWRPPSANFIPPTSPDRQTGIGQYSFAQFDRVMREG